MVGKIQSCSVIFARREAELKRIAQEKKKAAATAKKQELQQQRRQAIEERMRAIDVQAAEAPPLARSMLGINTALLNFSAHLIDMKDSFNRGFDELKAIVQRREQALNEDYNAAIWKSDMN